MKRIFYLISLMGLSHAELEQIFFESELVLPFCSSRDLSSLEHGNSVYDDLTRSQPPVRENETTHSPWASRTSCIQDLNGPDKHCAFSKPTFARNRGISIVAMPDVVERIFQMPPFQDPRIHENLTSNSDPPFVITQLPGRGTGVVASRTLHRGDRIFMETPALLVHAKVYDFLDDDVLPLQDLAVEGLPNKTRNLFMGLWGEWGGNQVDDIINTNSFALELLDQKETFSMVIPEISVGHRLLYDLVSPPSA
jgi:hypothetical protein